MRVAFVCILLVACHGGDTSSKFEIHRNIHTKSTKSSGLAQGGEGVPKLEVTGMTGPVADGLKKQLAASDLVKKGAVQVDVRLTPANPAKSAKADVKIYLQAVFAHPPNATKLEATLSGQLTFSNATLEQIGEDLGDAVLDYLTSEKLPVADIKPPGGAVAKAIKVAVGYPNCSLHEDGSMRCWDLDIKKPIQIANVDGTKQIEGAANFGMCGIRPSGAAFCIDAWSNEVALEVRDVCGVENAVEVSAGQSAACARIADGHVRCWPRDAKYFAPCGLKATEVKGITDAIAIDAGAFSACAIIKGGTAKCWSYDKPAAKPVKGLSNVSRIAALRTACGATDNTITCVDPDGKAPTSKLEIPETVMKIAQGHDGGLCTLGDKGHVYCGAGQLDPAQVPGIDDAIDLAADISDACIVTSKGAVTCWGDDPPKPIAF